MGKRGFTQTILETKTLSFAPIKGNRVLLRTEFNVPLKGTKITDDTRIQTSIPTIRALLDRGATNVVIVSHMGRPKKKDPALSMKPVGKRLSQLLGFTVPVVLGYDLKTVQKQFKRKMPRVILLENIRYHPGEEKNNMALGRSLSTLADIYVNDAFGTAHRCHASNGAVTSFLPSYIGLLMENELSHMQHVTETPSHPFVCVVGFAKISDKLSILTQLLKKADSVLIGGGVAFTFLAAQGHEVGTSLCEKSQIPLAKRLLKTYAHKIVLPIDVVCAPSLDSPVRMIVGVNSIPSNVAAYDVGPFTVTLFSKHIRNAKTVFWNGPLGVFEQQPFDASTNALAKVLADASEHGVQSIIGGGDTVSAINQAGVAHSMTHISTGGGASLEFVQGNPLAALLALSKSPKTSRRR